MAKTTIVEYPGAKLTTLIIDARLRLGSRAVMLGLGTSGLGSASRGGAARPSGQLASSDTVLFTVTSDIFFFFFLFRP